ncbi:MAG TPA: serpin family protein [Opitutaceae bacterium]|nr:serpin family protein [Opitutaceae bacterium]
MSPQSLRRAFCLLALGLAGGMISAAEPSATAPVTPPPPVAAPAPEDPLIAAVVESSNAFAADLYGQLRSEPGNLVFAPLGLMQALLPVAAGVEGTAAAELRSALHLSLPVTEAADGFGALTRRLQRAAGNETNLAFARALWVQQWNSINAGYVDLLRQHCRSELRVIDFARPEYAVHWINRWITDRTEDRITAIADAKSYAPDSCIVVANGVFFRTAWQQDFDPALTEAAPFQLPPPPEPVANTAAAMPAAAPVNQQPTTQAASPSGGQPAAAPVPELPAKPVTVEVSTMRRMGLLRTAVQPGCRLVEIPYRNDQLALVVLVPDEAGSLAQFEAQLTAAKIGECLRAVRTSQPAPLDLRLPRFKAERSLAGLESALGALGVKTAFDRAGRADFGVFGGNPDGAPLYLSAVSHLAKFAVDEKGATAVAATLPVSEAPYDAPVAVPTPFAVDRPFMFFVCDHQSGAVLFMGRVVDPRAS